MTKNLYIGNLSAEVTKEDLLENFKEAGEVISAVVIKDKYSGTSKGFGFVEMATEEAAQEAIQKFNGGSLYGRKIIVSEARPRPTSGGAKRRSGGGGGGFRNRGRF